MLDQAAEPENTVVFPAIAFALLGTVTSIEDGEPPECPSCGGALDLSQPVVHDMDTPALVGACADCSRIALFIEISRSVLLALPLPTRGEATSRLPASIDFQ